MPDAKQPAKPAEPIKPKHMGFDATRPFRQAYYFISGTIEGTLDGMSLWGRRGIVIGGLASVGYWFAGAAVAGLPLSGVIVTGLAGGLLAGAVLGGAIGLVTGGIQGVEKGNDPERKADALAKKLEKQKYVPPIGPTPEQRLRAQRRLQNINFARALDIENDNKAEHDQWRRQEMERRQHHHVPGQSGWGF
jgi:hypothetical protein